MRMARQTSGPPPSAPARRSRCCRVHPRELAGSDAASGSVSGSAAQAVLNDVFAGDVAEDAAIQTWEDAGTIASEERKRERSVFEAAESVTALDYDERIDRLSMRRRNLEDVRKIERLLADREIPREAVVSNPEYYAVPYDEPER